MMCPNCSCEINLKAAREDLIKQIIFLRQTKKMGYKEMALQLNMALSTVHKIYSMNTVTTVAKTVYQYKD